MELTTLARPYAKAAFEYALTHKALAKWSEMLATTSAVSQAEKIQQLLHSPGLTTAQQADAFVDVCDKELDKQGANFIRALASNKRLTLLPLIAELFELLKAEQEKSIDVTITSALELSGDQQDKLAKALSKRLGRDVNVVNEVDEELIGGLVIKAGDLVIDGSIRAKLHRLADAMKS